jgi:hypothetical protein
VDGGSQVERRDATRRLVVSAGAALAVALGAFALYRVSHRGVLARGPIRFADQLDVTTFRKGNIHTHTRNSDGDHEPEEVVAWYRDHGYAFVALTDHNTLTDPEGYRDLERPGTFVIIPGEEVTMSAPGGVPVHMNALCHSRTIGGGEFSTIRDALTWGTAEIAAQRGVALVNHPNFEWALAPADLRWARGAQLLEIWSGHPHVHSAGDLLRPSEEAIWEAALASDLRFAGVAVDDMHYLDAGPQEPAAGPGRGWVQVFAADVTRESICGALARGELYASSGAELKRIHVGGDVIAIETDAPGALVEFVGEKSGSWGNQIGVLATERPAPGSSASYRLKGDERYVRARVTSADGARAWTKAYFTLP